MIRSRIRLVQRSVAWCATLVALVAALVTGCVGSSLGDERVNVESEHGVALPESAADYQTVGDTGLVTIIDHGVTSVFTIDSADLDAFLGSLPAGESANYADHVGPPSNRQYQPTSTPWDSGAQPELAVTTDSPAGGDYLSVVVYPVSDERVGLLLYSDWN